MMSEPLADRRDDAFLSQLTCSAEAFHAKTSVLPVEALASTELSLAYGLNSTDSLASFDLDTSSWRTSQLCLLGGLDEFSETWPRAGLMRNGTVYPRVPLAPLTDVIVSGLLPTPVAKDDGKSFEAHMAMKARMPGGPRKTCTSLAVMARSGMWPTPSASEHKYRLQGFSQQSKCLNALARGQLNPTWVEWLMGYPLGWTACAAWETQSSRKSQSGLHGASKKQKGTADV